VLKIHSLSRLSAESSVASLARRDVKVAEIRLDRLRNSPVLRARIYKLSRSKTPVPGGSRSERPNRILDGSRLPVTELVGEDNRVGRLRH